MAIRSRAQLKDVFETGDMPTGDDFADLIDSFWHKSETVGSGNAYETPEEVRDALLTLTTAWLPYSRITGAPSPGYTTGAQVKAALEGLPNGSKLNGSAIEGLEADMIFVEDDDSNFSSNDLALILYELFELSQAGGLQDHPASGDGISIVATYTGSTPPSLGGTQGAYILTVPLGTRLHSLTVTATDASSATTGNNYGMTISDANGRVNTSVTDLSVPTEGGRKIKDLDAEALQEFENPGGAGQITHQISGASALPSFKIHYVIQ